MRNRGLLSLHLANGQNAGSLEGLSVALPATNLDSRHKNLGPNATWDLVTPE